jgi:class 3 adenylate cyclase/tetratricopeptide (TPR) repeat protein
VVCSSCGTENDAGVAFCDACGTALASGCPSCGAANRPGARFCAKCGTGLATARGPIPSSVPRPAAPAPVAERRLVSVLFADLVGFTPFAEERDAEDTRETLSRYFDLASEVIIRYGGTVEKFIGDAVMAVWGAPVAREDDAERAVRAGLELVDAVRILGPTIQARAGVLTGEVAVTLGATNQGMVAGDLVNTAARLQSVAPPGAVLVGEATHRAASQAIAFEEAGEQALKGKIAPIPAWRALRVVAERGGQGRSDLPEPPFVGRDEELRLLKDLVSATGRDRKTRLVSVTGPAGIGKSRLAWELEKYLAGPVDPVYLHRGRSPAYGDGITFWALGEMVRRRVRLAETDDETTSRERIAAAVAEYVSDADDRRWVEPALLTLLGLEPAPAGGRDVLFAAWRIFFERIAEKGTTILLFEDLQWADTGLLDFIDHLLEWSRGAPILVVTLARPELFDKRPDWGAARRHFTAIALEPLPEPAMRELLAGFVPGLPGAAVEAILTRAEGIPLYAVETIRALVTDGRLERAEDGYRPVGDLGELAIPETLRSLIASRLDGLEAIDRELVQDAAVLGQTFTLAGLASVSGVGEGDLAARLRGLVRREVFEVDADPRSPERGQYRFVQSLIREVAHATLARPERRARHLAVAGYFETLVDDELAGALATHYLAAHAASVAGAEADAVGAKARLALRAAAERAASLGAHDQAVAYLQQALAVTVDLAEQADLLVRAAQAAETAADHATAAGFARRAAVAFGEAGDALAAARANALLGEILLGASQIEAAIEVLEATLAALPEAGADDVKAALLANLSRSLFRHDAPERAIEVADRALAIAERLNLDQVVVEAFINKATALTYVERRREAATLMEAAVRLAEAGGYIGAELRARHNLAWVVEEDEPRRAGEIARAALDLARRVGDRGMAVWLSWVAGWCTYREGDDWTSSIAATTEDLGAALAPSDEEQLLSSRCLFLVARGDDRDEDFSRLEALGTTLPDQQMQARLEMNRGDRALLQGHHLSAFEAFLRSTDLYSAWTGVGLPLALRAALWMKDVERARATARRLDDFPASGRTVQVDRAAAAAGIAALEGRSSDAVAGYLDVLQRWQGLGLYFDFARAALDFVLLVGPEVPEARTAAAEARPIFERLGARPYLERLDAALARSSEPVGVVGALAKEGQ